MKPFLSTHTTSPRRESQLFGALAVAFVLFAMNAVNAAPFVRGDINRDRDITIADGVGTLRFLFTGQERLPCRAAADVNSDGGIGIEDGLQTLQFLFLGGKQPQPPFPDCGEDDSTVSLGCESGLDCETQGERADPADIRNNSLALYKSSLPCNSQEPQPCEPGPCTVEVRIEQVQVTSGQGITEGMFELSVDSEVDAGAGATGSSSWPGGGDTQKVDVGHSKTIGDLVATFQIGPNETRPVEICFDVTEFDGFGVNGDSDVGRVCTTVMVQCGTVIHDTVRTKLCKGDKRDNNGNCKKFNGQVAIDFSVRGGEDVDCDGVVNELDFTPDPCDEANLGQRGGRALILYFSFQDGPFKTLFQELGTNLNKVMEGYDYIVLLKEDADFLGLTLSAAAVNRANLVLDPTAANYIEAFRDVTSKGYSFDHVKFAHGGVYVDTLGSSTVAQGSWVETIDGVKIDETWIAANLGDPAVTGTRALPMVMSYSVACYYGRLNAAWLAAGAKCAGAPTGFNFYPLRQKTFTNDWNAGSTYADAVANAEASAGRFLADAYITAEATDNLTIAAALGDVPAGCILNVTGHNDCAEWYFENGTGDAGGPYDFFGTYDDTVSGQDNMIDSSIHVFSGNGNVTKSTTHTW